MYSSHLCSLITPGHVQFTPLFSDHPWPRKVHTYVLWSPLAMYSSHLCSLITPGHVKFTPLFSDHPWPCKVHTSVLWPNQAMYSSHLCSLTKPGHVQFTPLFSDHTRPWSSSHLCCLTTPDHEAVHKSVLWPYQAIEQSTSMFSDHNRPCRSSYIRQSVPSAAMINRPSEKNTVLLKCTEWKVRFAWLMALEIVTTHDLWPQLFSPSPHTHSLSSMTSPTPPLSHLSLPH